MSDNLKMGIVSLAQMDSLLQLDVELFYLINKALSNTLFDVIMPILRNKYFWFPAYVFIVMSLFTHYKRGKALLYIISILSCFVLTDLISSQIIKKSVERIRPCNEVVLVHKVQERVRCGYGFSFPSSHAANHFGLSFFLIGLFGFKRWIRSGLVLWAMLVSFAQVYVGLHYPIDIIAGALLGIVIARLFLQLLYTIRVLEVE